MTVTRTFLIVFALVVALTSVLMVVSPQFGVWWVIAGFVTLTGTVDRALSRSEIE